DGRESFNRHYPGIDYQTMLERSTPAPIYDIQVKCLAPLGLNDIAVITTRYVPKRGARLDFQYEIRRESDGALCCTGSTTQLFIDKDGNQLLDLPDFYVRWKEQYGVK
ncbi:MAG: acyl-CoA thioesterase, partial [Prevotella sp.]|nr:acyl-CoA thioesterase [Prevotella sp.]